jgi:hypothetical protein
MTIRKCSGPNGKPGVRSEPAGKPAGECHIWDPEAPDADVQRAAAVRAAVREENAVISHGDPRMMRDG